MQTKEQIEAAEIYESLERESNFFDWCRENNWGQTDVDLEEDSREPNPTQPKL